MPHPLPTRKLPARPDLDQLKRQAKELLDAFRSGEHDAQTAVNSFYRGGDPATFALHDAQLVLARSYGYDSWPKLKAHVDGVTGERLIDAVRANDVEEVTRILGVRPELAATYEATTALRHAVVARTAPMVRTLVRLGVNPHSEITPLVHGTTAFTIATERGYDDIAAMMRDEEKRREHGGWTVADVPSELRRALPAGDEGRTIAILEQHPELVGLEVPGDRWTPLHLASATLSLRTATWLLDHGANIDARARDGSTPLDVVGMQRDPRHVERKTAIIELLRGRGAALTPRSAVMVGDVEFLRERHADSDLTTSQDDRGWLLRLAVDYDRPHILKLLLDWGLDPDARARVYGPAELSFTWGMPLYQCARYGKHDMARVLLERGADPNAEVYASGTPLSEAYGQRDEAMIALLEQHGGRSNPSMAGLYRRKDLAERLLAEHGDAELPDDGFSSGSVAQQLIGAAARGGDPEILAIALPRVDWPTGDRRWYGALKAAMGFFNHWIGPWCHHEWDRSTYLTCFRMILDRCGPPTAQLNFGTTVLHAVVTMADHVRPEERAAFAASALDAGARIDARDELLQSTPLGWACRWGREELVRLFLARGADPVEADAEPWARPLAWAEKQGHAHLAALLRQAGAS